MIPEGQLYIVLAPYRSGTSITSRVMSRLGVDFGPDDQMFRGNKFNPGGYFERADVNTANTKFIESAGGSLAEPGNPEDLQARGRVKVLQKLNFDWAQGSLRWGLKDPRLCATLNAWLNAGIIDRQKTRLIHVTRDLEATVNSVCSFPHVLSYCDGSRDGARRMIERYRELAEWQMRETGLPSHRLDYDAMLADPPSQIQPLAEFIGENDAAKIRRAIGEIGKKRGRLRWLLADLPLLAIRRGPTKIKELLRGADR